MRRLNRDATHVKASMPSIAPTSCSSVPRLLYLSMVFCSSVIVPGKGCSTNWRFRKMMFGFSPLGFDQLHQVRRAFLQSHRLERLGIVEARRPG